MKGPTGTVLSIDRKDVRSWNPNNVWLQTGSHPDTYLPFGMSGILPVDDAHGQWVTDPQDHSRFYLPNEGSSRYPREYLVEQARIATNRMPKIAIPFAVAGQMLGGALQGAGH